MNHEITIDNFQSRETVSYSILIIKGIIKHNSDTRCRDDKIYINTPRSSFKVVDSTFKVLIELKLGENLINLRYCCAASQITINYCPRQTQFTVLPLYIICGGHDGAFQAPITEKNDLDTALKRITLSIKLLQSVVSEKLYEGCQGRKTFQLEDNCRVFYSRLNYLSARKMSQNELWRTLSEEIIASDMEHERIKFVGFLSCTKYSGENFQDNLKHEDIVKITEAYVALGGGGLALFGTACLYTWPENLSEVITKFEDLSPVDKHQFMDDSCYRGTLGACFSTTLGSVLHELCHTFDLGHTEKGIMGRGFDDIFKVFTTDTNSSKSDIWTEHQKSVQFGEQLGKAEKNVEKRRVFSTKSINIENVEDGTFWTRSCLIFLAYHRWLNSFEPSRKQIKFINDTRVVSSTAGLRVIELRNEDNGMVLLHWVFDDRILKYSFQIPEDKLKSNYKYLMFVEDNIGNVLKRDVNIDSKQ